MDEREMLEKIADSAQDLPVPKHLQPDQVRRQLKGRPYKTGKHYRMIAAAACLCLCFGIGLFVSEHDVRKMSGSLVQDGESSNAQEQKDRKRRGWSRNGGRQRSSQYAAESVR